MIKKIIETLRKRLVPMEEFSGELMCLKSKYGTGAYNYEEVLERTFESVKTKIKEKIEFSREERLLVLSVPEDRKDLYEDLRKKFIGLGFKSFYLEKGRIKELGDRTYLVISWDIN